VIRPADQPVVFFGCPLDCDEKYDAIEEKHAQPAPEPGGDDPLLGMVQCLARRVPENEWEFRGSIEVPGWLRPIPPEAERGSVVVDDMVAFIDGGGCKTYADRVADAVRSEILPGFPFLVTVEHSLTGGVYRALADHYGRDKLSLVVLDSHTDAIPMSRLAGAIFYDIDTNPGSVYDASDPFLHDRAESYNASTFLHHMVAEGLLDPRDLYLLGVSDYPEKKVFRIKDRRIADYVSAFAGLRKEGATIVTKKECQLKPAKVNSLLRKIRTPYVYLSVDMDIGARNALDGVRFRNWQGLSEKQIYRLADSIAAAGGRDLQLVGMDITEINPRTAGMDDGSQVDRTYEIAANLGGRLVFDRPCL